MRAGIEKFIAVVSRFTERDKVLETLHALRRTKEYKFPTASMFALHVILDLYSDDSSPLLKSRWLLQRRFAENYR